MKITICFKNGTKITVNCEKFESRVNQVTGRIESYKFIGIKGTSPVYIDINEILWITRD